MESVDTVILISAGLIVLSIFAGLVSSRLGAPLLLVFLALGMLAGEDGPGGIVFDDFATTYVVGSIALAIILFDGGLRTSRASFRLAYGPALPLATAGVLITAATAGAFASWLFGFNLLGGLLVGAVVGSTDAAAVFFLLRLRNVRLPERVGATIELESALNDPMAIFLTLTCVGLLTAGNTDLSGGAWQRFAVEFGVQIAGGAVTGIVGGYALLGLVNQMRLAPGLYPVLAVSFALVVFATAEVLGASGFLAIFLVGFVLGNNRHRSTEMITRFHDGLAWLAQIAMFLLLGLLLTPTTLLPKLAPSLGVAIFLILVARPVAVVLCLAPFRFFGFTWRETAYVCWVGLRGAVPILLGTIPVLAGVGGAADIFAVAFVVVLTSLIVQGWTVPMAARILDLQLPPRPLAPQRVDIELPGQENHDMAAYTVQPNSVALRLRLDRLPFPPDTTVLSVLRDSVMRNPAEVDRLAAGDYVMLLVPADGLATLDRIFGARQPRRGREPELGEFAVDPSAPAGALAELYDFSLPRACRRMPVGDLLVRHIFGRPRPGKMLRLGEVVLIVQQVEDARIVRIGIDLDPSERPAWHRLDEVRVWQRAMFEEALRRLRQQRQGWRRGPAGGNGSTQRDGLSEAPATDRDPAPLAASRSAPDPVELPDDADGIEPDRRQPA